MKRRGVHEETPQQIPLPQELVLTEPLAWKPQGMCVASPSSRALIRPGGRVVPHGCWHLIFVQGLWIINDKFCLFYSFAWC